jgi:hypothetical protein
MILEGCPPAAVEFFIPNSEESCDVPTYHQFSARLVQAQGHPDSVPLILGIAYKRLFDFTGYMCH